LNSTLYGTASYAVTTSYSLQSSTASYTTAVSINTSSYSITTISSSTTLTASAVTGLFYGPNSSIGYISSNIYIGAPNIFASLVTGTTFNGIMLSPILINKPCTLTTMSIVGGSGGTLTASLGIYSNSNTNNLPEFLIASGTLRTGAVTGPSTFHVSNFTPITLNANSVYWIAFLPNATTVGGISNWKWLYGSDGSTFYTLNPLLNTKLSYNTSSINGFPAWSIRTGSNPVAAGPYLPLTASQDTGSYSLPAASGTGTGGGFGSACILPVLKVTYP
jgi:hypothetical protein